MIKFYNSFSESTIQMLQQGIKINQFVQGLVV